MTSINRMLNHCYTTALNVSDLLYYYQLPTHLILCINRGNWYSSWYSYSLIVLAIFQFYANQVPPLLLQILGGGVESSWDGLLANPQGNTILCRMKSVGLYKTSDFGTVVRITIFYFTLTLCIFRFTAGALLYAPTHTHNNYVHNGNHNLILDCGNLHATQHSGVYQQSP